MLNPAFKGNNPADHFSPFPKQGVNKQANVYRLRGSRVWRAEPWQLF